VNSSLFYPDPNRPLCSVITIVKLSAVDVAGTKVTLMAELFRDVISSLGSVERKKNSWTVNSCRVHFKGTLTTRLHRMIRKQ